MAKLLEKLEQAKKTFEEFGPRNTFAKEVSDYQKAAGVNEEAAKGAVLRRKLEEADIELRRSGRIAPPEDKRFREFRIGLEALFSQQVLDDFRVFAEDPSVWRDFPLPATGKEKDKQEKKSKSTYKAAETYFKNRYNNRAPDPLVIEEFSKNLILLENLLQRITNEISLSDGESLEAILSSHPEKAADMGKMVLVREVLKNGEKRFAKEASLQEGIRDTKEKAPLLITEILFKAPIDFAAQALKGVASGKLEGTIMNMIKASFTFMAREGIAIGKLTWLSARVLYNYINKRRGK